MVLVESVPEGGGSKGGSPPEPRLGQSSLILSNCNKMIQNKADGNILWIYFLQQILCFCHLVSDIKNSSPSPLL